MPNIFRTPVAIDKGVYAMSMADGKNAEITMYGQIVAQQPTNWWGEPIPGDYIIQSEFLADLDSVSKAKSVTIRMNSLGGDAGVSILIHNRLRELAAKGTALICIVDGVAMSGGSIIMSACDTVKVNPSSLIMIHNCWSTLWGGYNAAELREEAAACEAWDKAQVEIYKRMIELREAEEYWDTEQTEVGIWANKYVMIVRPKSFDPGGRAPMGAADANGEYVVYYFAGYRDGKQLWEVDKRNMKCVIMGKDYMADIRKALGK